MEFENDVSFIIRAACFAAHKHRRQQRDDAAATPYINHPLALAKILSVDGNVTDPTVLVAALLHDTVEDTDTSIEEVEAEFGKSVARIVAEVTDDPALDRAARKQHQIDAAPYKSHGAKLVKLADKIANLRDVADNPPAHWTVERRLAYFDWADQVAAGLRGSHPVLENVFDIASAGRAGIL